MARTVHLRLTNDAEQLLKDIEDKLGFDEEEVFAKAVGLLETAFRTNRVALIKEDYKQRNVEAVEHYLSVKAPSNTNGSTGKVLNS